MLLIIKVLGFYKKSKIKDIRKYKKNAKRYKLEIMKLQINNKKLWKKKIKL